MMIYYLQIISLYRLIRDNPRSLDECERDHHGTFLQSPLFINGLLNIDNSADDVYTDMPCLVWTMDAP